MPNNPSALPTVGALIEAELPTARWFAGRNREARVTATTPLPALTADIPVVALEIAEVRYADDPGAVDHYLVPLCYRPPADAAGPGLGVAIHPELGAVAVHDATTDPYATDILLDLVAADRELTQHGATLRSHLVDGSALRPGLPGRRFGGEQSNTSVMFGDVALLKFFRRLEQGRNPDIEVHRALAGGPAAKRIAALYAWLDAHWTDSRGTPHSADLGMLVEQLRPATDGWDFALDCLRRGEDFSAYARSLGRALREVHNSLLAMGGTAQSTPAVGGTAQSTLAVGGTAQRKGVEEAAAMRTRLGATIAEVARLAPLHGALDSRLSVLEPLDYPAQRIHGDFHLGQVLMVGRDPAQRSWRIIDFEGEPLKSFEERRQADTVWRDVAGMLRSLDYAGAYAIRHEQVAPGFARDWVSGARDSFLAAYAENGLDLDEQRVLRAYLIDKAVYECRYEARHRPEWLPIPLAALAALAGTDDDIFDGGWK